VKETKRNNCDDDDTDDDAATVQTAKQKNMASQRDERDENRLRA
jgi:hypothetical protein